MNEDGLAGLNKIVEYTGANHKVSLLQLNWDTDRGGGLPGLMMPFLLSRAKARGSLALLRHGNYLPLGTIVKVKESHDSLTAGRGFDLRGSPG